MRHPLRSTLTTTAALALLGGVIGCAAPASADPPMHQVRYSVTSDAPYFVHIYYRDSEPAMFSDYSHNPYVFSPRVDADVAPDKPWVLETQLANPDLWAMVTVQSGESTDFPAPGFNCELAVDGVVVATNSGPKGALCSIRNW